MEYQQLYFKTTQQWRKWLKENHNKCRGIWFVFYKQQTGKKTISYGEAVEEALCYGWIDSIAKKLDDEKYIQKFTPRINSAKWSQLNIERMKKLIKEKRMRKQGLSKFPPELLTSSPAIKKKPDTMFPIPPFIEEAFKENKKAGDFFYGLAPSYRRNYIRWVASAKKEETQVKRLNELIEVMNQNKKLGLK